MSALRDRVITALRDAEPALRERGVLHLALAGSVARDTARDDSDVDVLIDLDASRRIGVFTIVDIQFEIENRVGRKTDVVNRRGLRPGIRESIERHSIQVF